MTEEQKQTLEQLTRKGRLVYQTLKGDWAQKKMFVLIGTVEDQVWVITGDVRHSIERIRTPKADVCYRTCYFTWDSRIRANRNKLQIGYGQYPSILCPYEQGTLLMYAQQKGWEAFVSPQTSCEPMPGLGSQGGVTK